MAAEEAALGRIRRDAVRLQSQLQPAQAFGRLATRRLLPGGRQSLFHLRSLEAVEGQQRLPGGLRVRIRIYTQYSGTAVVPSTVATDAVQQKMPAGLDALLYPGSWLIAARLFESQNTEGSGCDPCGSAWNEWPPGPRLIRTGNIAEHLVAQLVYE